MQDPNLKYLAALNNIFLYRPGIAKRVIEETGSAEAALKIVTDNPSQFGIKRSHSLSLKELLQNSGEEINWAIDKGIKIISYNHPQYPETLLECSDHPILLYCRGEMNLNQRKIISVVGTRRATSQGLINCEKIIEETANLTPDAVIVSGMAYGIDIAAHKAALKNKLETTAILATGLKEIYPVAHNKYASKIASKGALISEYPFIKEGFKYNFLRRNRIIAGICDVIIIVESAEKGGAIITAKLANSYSREVYALPGRVTDPMSSGCNRLISKNMARLFTSTPELLDEMQWLKKKSKKNNFNLKTLFSENSIQKEKILLALKSNNELDIDNIARLTSLPVKEISVAITELEIENRITGSPGGFYHLN